MEPRTVLSMIRLQLLALLPVLAIAPCSFADVFELEAGGRLVGVLAEGADREAGQITIDLTDGGRVTLNRRQVARILPQSPAQAEYARRSPTVADTVEAQWRLALWCRDQKMTPELNKHLLRVTELDPLHEEAHKLLGYQRVDGRWVTRDELQASRGLFRFEGDYRTPQEIEILKRAKRGKLIAADWKGQLAQWRRWLTSNNPERSAEAERAFNELDNPAAAAPLARLIKNETDYGVRSLLIDTASRIEHPAAVQALVQLSLNDSDEETRLQCLEHLVKARRPGLAAPYLQALKSKNNTKVNRAGEALGEIGATEAISPLIDALVTTHRIKVGNEGGGDQYSFTPTSGGFQFGGGGPKEVPVDAKNPKVLSALVRLTEGVSFGYDQSAWRAWLTSQATATDVDLRRDL